MHHLQRLISFVWPFVSASCYAIGGQAVITGNGPAVQYVGPVVNGGPNVARVIYGGNAIDLSTYERAIRNASGGGASVTDRVSVNTSRGAITVRATSAISGRAIARGAAVAARAMPAAGIAIGVGSIIWELMDDNDIKPDGAGALNRDPGKPATDGAYNCWYTLNPNDTACYATLDASAAAAVAYATKDTSNGCSASLGGVNLAYPYGYYTIIVDCPQASSVSTTYATSDRVYSGKSCDNPDGVRTPPRKDGKCALGVSEPLTNEQVIDIIARDVTDQEDKVPLVNDILSSPGGAIDLDPGATTTSGPSSQSGTPPAPVVANGPEGQTTTTESPEIAIRYRGPEIEWEPQQVTTRRPSATPGGPDEVTTTDAPDLPSADPGSNVTPDYCLSNPKRAGCSELGEVEPPEWEPDEKPIELKAESPWGSDNASCPPPRTLVIGGKQFLWEWTLVCDFFSGIRFAVIASAWIAAVMIFIGSRSDA